MNDVQKNIKSHNVYWLITLIISITLMTYIGFMWHKVDSSYQPNAEQLTTEKKARDYFFAKRKDEIRKDPNDFIEVPTGVYLQAMKFMSANDVYFNGTIWQTFPNEIEVKNPKLYFPEKVNGSTSTTLKYKNVTANETTYGWDFEVTVRQPFEYGMYPLDHKTVWLRILPDNLECKFLFENAGDCKFLLLPDLSSYPSTEASDTFGLDDNIILGNWEVEETFFDFKSNKYATNFGHMAKTNNIITELHFNVVVKRKFVNAFVVHLIPMLTVAVMLFMILLSFSHNTQKAGVNGFSKMGVIGAISALFFIVVISHVSVRTELPTHGLIYIEYFYLILYVLMTLLVIGSFLSYNEKHWFLKIFKHDSLIIKLIYWPLLLASVAISTHFALL